MTILDVDRSKWFDCYHDTYVYRQPDNTNKLLLERYGIERWDKINLDKIRITFVDEKKMSYWIMRWS